MSFLRAKPIGVMPMIDQGEQDDKIIAVHADDPEFKGYSDISELPKHRLMEIKRFALSYLNRPLHGHWILMPMKPGMYLSMPLPAQYFFPESLNLGPDQC